MRGLQIRGCLSAFIRAIFITDRLLTGVRGEDSAEEIDAKYALIGAGIGLLLVAVFVIVKLCLMRRDATDDNTEAEVRRPSQPQYYQHAARFLSQSDQPVSAVFIEEQS